MGLRATSVKKYEIKYGDVQGFNYDPGTLSNIICHFCEDCYVGGEDTDTNCIWEIDRNEFFHMTSRLCEMSDKEFNEMMRDQWDEGTRFNDAPYTKKEVTDLFKGYYNDTPEDSNYVRIAWL